MTRRNIDFAEHYVGDFGFAVLPIHTPIGDGRCSCRKPECLHVGKHPRIAGGVHNASHDLDQVDEWWKQWPDANIAIATGEASGLVVVDVDGPEGEASLNGVLDSIPDAPRCITGLGFHLYFQHPGTPVRNSSGLMPRLDVRSDGGYVIAPPSRHRSNAIYQWGSTNLTTALPEIPDVLLKLMHSPKESSTTANTGELPSVINEGERNNTLYGYARFLKKEGADRATISEQLIIANEARCKPPLADSEIKGITDSASSNKLRKQSTTASDEYWTDVGNAKRLVRLFGDQLRYLGPDRTWLVWNGKYWERDETGQVTRRAKETARGLFDDASGIEDEEKRKKARNWAMRAESVSKIRAMIELAKSDAQIAVVPAQLDPNGWLLNVENGTIDLKTGKLREHSRSDLITRMAPVVYDPTSVAPRWNEFLLETMGGDEEMVAYLQRLVGYTLTGDVREEILLFVYGSGANGKTTFLCTIEKMLCDYAKTIDPELLISKQNATHPTGRADLRGVRFAICSEVDDGKHFAEAVVKQITSRDTQKARRMHGNWFEFEPSHKLWLAANHKPVIKGTDDGIWRRIHLIPFTVTVPEDKRDRRLIEKLRAELPGILAWAVRGCLEWLDRGLRTPDRVIHATREYRDDMDLLAQFIQERCIEDPAAEIWARQLYAEYKHWCEECGLHAVSHKRLGREIGQRFNKRDSTGGMVLYEGLKLAESGENAGH